MTRPTVHLIISFSFTHFSERVPSNPFGTLDPCIQSRLKSRTFLTSKRSRVSSGSIVSGYGLDDRAIEVRSPAEANNFSSSLCVQTGSEAHPASCIMGTGGPIPGGKARPGRDADRLPHLVPRSSMSRSYASSPPCASIDVLWDCFTFTLPAKTFIIHSRVDYCL
jgi:hypothetical protein